jgi:hypothetical protein
LDERRRGRVFDGQGTANSRTSTSVVRPTTIHEHRVKRQAIAAREARRRNAWLYSGFRTVAFGVDDGQSRVTGDWTWRAWTRGERGRERASLGERGRQWREREGETGEEEATVSGSVHSAGASVGAIGGSGRTGSGVAAGTSGVGMVGSLPGAAFGWKGESREERRRTRRGCDGSTEYEQVLQQGGEETCVATVHMASRLAYRRREQVSD